MPQIISCPDCRRKLRVPENLFGKKVKCPGCGVKFAAEAEEQLDELEEVQAPPSPPPSRRPREEGVVEKPSKSRRRDDEEENDLPARRSRREEEPEDDEDDEPQKHKPKKREIYKGWERVRFGINLVIISIWIAVCGYLAIIVLTFLMGAIAGGARVPVGFVVAISLALVALVALGSGGAHLTGLGFCTAVVSTPRTQAIKMLAIASFGLAVAIAVIQMFSFGAARITGLNAGVLLNVVSWMCNLLSLAEAVCFLFFMRGVAVFMRRDDLVRAVTVYMIILAVLFGLCVVAVVILRFAGMAAALTVGSTPAAPHNATPNLAGFVVLSCLGMIVAFGVGLTLIIRLILLLYQVRSAVDRWLDRN